MTDDPAEPDENDEPPTVAGLAADLRAEARRADERRLLVLAGDREAGYDAARTALDAADVPPDGTTLVGRRDALDCERVATERADSLLGTTRTAVVYDAHDALDPDALGRVVGAVDGGGLLVLLSPPLDEWPDRRDGFDETLAVPPHDAGDVGGRFRRRLIETLRVHPGIAIVDVDAGRVERDGLTDPAPRWPPPAAESPAERRFPDAAYEACLTADQAGAVAALEALCDPGQAVVVEADRGRGKSSAAGIAAACLAARGDDVLVTAPSYRGAAEVFARARALLATLGALAGVGGPDDAPRRLDAAGGGAVRFRPPAAAADAVAAAFGDPVEGSGGDESAGGDRAPGDGGDARNGRSGGRGREVEDGPDVADDRSADGETEAGRGTESSSDAAEGRTAGPDVVIVDEAAALPVRLLSRLLAAGRVAFATTVHGYEGAGRGFSVRFRDRLAGSDLAVTDARMAEPIRYAPGDPVEVWAFRALLLSAGPAPAQVVAGATPDSVAYRALEPAALVADEHLLAEAFGLLVVAHYRTTPSDLARLLDAPNVAVRALVADGHVVSVALLAREGGLPEDVRADLYEGGRVRGHMLPDVLTSQLRDEEGGVPAGLRVMRVATHHAVRSRGLGSHLLARVRGEFADDVDWLGTGYGATPDLLSFWAAAGYRTVHLSTTRNEASGEHSALMLLPTSDAGRDLHDRHARWFARRVGSMLSDPLDDLDPDVARAALRTVEAPVPLDLDAREWRVVAGAAYGPGLYDVAPGPFRRVAVRHLVDPADPAALTARQERLLVLKVLQARGWDAVADALDYPSRRQCMRALGDALQPLVDLYGDEAADEVRERFSG